MKKKSLVLLFIFFLLVTSSTIVRAESTNNPIFATITGVQQMISTALSPIQTAITNLTGKVNTVTNTQNNHSSQITTLQNQVSDLEARIAKLEATPTPTPTLVPTTGTTFYDDFNGYAVDQTKWNIISNGGLVKEENDYLSLGPTGIASPYPFIHTKSNPFPTTDTGFQVEIKFKIAAPISNQDGMTIAATALEQPADSNFGNSPYINNTNYWMMVNSGKFQFGLGITGNNAEKPFDTNWHTLVFERQGQQFGGVSNIYFDGEKEMSSTLNFSKPIELWMGITNSLGFGSYQYPDMLIDYVKVSSL